MDPRDLIDEFEVLHRLVTNSRPVGDPLRRVFDEAWAAWADGDVTAPVEQMWSTRKAFYALPDAEQRAILNGWSPCPVRTPHRRLVACAEGEAVARVLSIGESPAGGLMAVQDFAHNSSTRPVRVEIREGAKKAEVVNVLRQALALVETHYEQMVGGRPDGDVTPREKQEGRTPEPSDDPTELGGKWIDRAATRTPALVC